MTQALNSLIEARCGRHVRAIQPLGGGCVGEVYRADLADGLSVALKVDRGNNPRLHIEGGMLRFLAANSALPVPQVIHCDPDLLIMEFLPGGSRFNAAAEEDAARHLASLHKCEAARHGLENDTLIGGLHQPNGQCDAWIEFFRDRRLLYMAGEARKSRNMDGAFYKRVAALAENLDRFLDEPARPALLHGDVWTSNVLAEDGRITGFIDPAVYYGHPEIELAFITLFSTFSARFFQAYGTIRPLAPGFFEVRRDIYNLYPLLVHTCLFGSSYLSGIDTTLRRHGY